jgi:hypothetical protein
MKSSELLNSHAFARWIIRQSARHSVYVWFAYGRMYAVTYDSCGYHEQVVALD